MKKFLTRGLAGVGALTIPLGASLALLPGTAFAGTTDGQGAQTAPMMTGGSPVCGAPGYVGGHTFGGNSFATVVLDHITGDVTTTVHLQDTTPNSTYYTVLYRQNCDGGPWGGEILSTNAQGNGTVSFVTTNLPTFTSARVALFASDWSPTPIGSPTIPLS